MLLLSIADINLLFKSDLEDRFIKAGLNSRNFIRRDDISIARSHIDCILSIEECPSAFNIEGTEAFSHTGPWRLYCTEDGYEIAFFSPPLSTDYYMVAKVSKDFSRGKLYVKHSRKKRFIISHPLDQLLVINLLSRNRGLMVHSCCINDNGKGFLFAGTSRAGKSTTAKLWLNEAGVKVLSDDRIIIRQIDGKIFAYGTPWHGELEISDPGRVEIEKIFFLQHSEKNYVKQLSPIDSAARMFVRSFPTFWDKEGLAFTLSFIDEIVRKIPCYELGFLPDKSAVEFVRGL